MLIDSVNQIGFSNVEDDEISDEISAVIYHSIIVSNLAYKVGKELGLYGKMLWLLHMRMLQYRQNSFEQKA